MVKGKMTLGFWCLREINSGIDGREVQREEGKYALQAKKRIGVRKRKRKEKRDIILLPLRHPHPVPLRRSP